MEIDNNQLVARYYDLQAQNAGAFAAVNDYIMSQLGELYDDLLVSFADTVVFQLDDAMAAAEKAGLKLDPAEAEIAVTNYVLKTVDSLGLWIQPQEESDPNTIVAKLNFGNRSRYY
ncbi:hypothetical protein [Lacticaseibacillus sp. GG6-2]